MDILVQNARVAFAKGLFEASAAEAGGKPKFNSKFIIPPDHPQVEEIRAAEAAVAKEKWGDKAPAVLKQLRATADKMFLKDGDTQNSDGFEGMLFFSANKDTRPSTYDRARTPVTAQDGVIYSGCYVNVRVSIWAMDNQFGKRINGELNGVQFVRDGDAFGGGSKAADADDFPDLDAGGIEDPFN